MKLKLISEGEHKDAFGTHKWKTYAQIPTNADRIRAMNDEELAVQIAWPYLASPPWCAEHTTCPYISEDPTPCNKCALEWLKQEAKE